MVFSGAQIEHLQLNEESLWSGYPREHNNPEARAFLPRVRQAVFAGDYALADQLAKHMQGLYIQSYLPLGDLFLEFDHPAELQGYHRWLDLDTAIHHTEYSIGAFQYTRQAFISAPANAMVLRVSSSQPRALSLAIRISSPLHSHFQAVDSQILLTGKVPQHVEPQYVEDEHGVIYGDEGMTFAIRLGIQVSRGSTRAEADCLRVSKADEVLLVLCAATSYNGFDRSPAFDGKDPLEITSRYLTAAIPRTYQDLLREHLAEYQPLYQRVEIHLGDPPSSAIPIDRRIAAFQTDHDPSLVELLFQYGRYLLIASSRPHTLPANLQGLWNDLFRPPWSSNYTININTQMNYWPAETANLPECSTALFEFSRISV